MRHDYSRTAEGMAMIRALEQSLPASRRIINDPCARSFLINRFYRLAANSRLISRLLIRFLNYWAPGSLEFLTVRPRLVDDRAVKLAGEGLQQIVILGAGFDTIALRIEESLRGVIVFEVDHPATQTVKREIMLKIGTPGNLRFVAVDFEKDDLVKKLCASGFDPARKSFIVWVGVSYYLTDRAAARTFNRIAALSNDGTQVVWDYLLAEVIDGTTHNRDAMDKARRAATLGEPWLFGLKTEDVQDFIGQFGFGLIEDYDPERLRAIYCPERPTPMNYLRIVVCKRNRKDSTTGNTGDTGKI